MVLRAKFVWSSVLALKDEVINILYFVVRRVGRRMECKGMGHKELDYWYDEECQRKKRQTQLASERRDDDDDER
jgi:hypothetical protein